MVVVETASALDTITIPPQTPPEVKKEKELNTETKMTTPPKLEHYNNMQMTNTHSPPHAIMPQLLFTHSPPGTGNISPTSMLKAVGTAPFMRFSPQMHHPGMMFVHTNSLSPPGVTPNNITQPLPTQNPNHTTTTPTTNNTNTSGETNNKNSPNSTTMNTHKTNNLIPHNAPQMMQPTMMPFGLHNPFFFPNPSLATARAMASLQKLSPSSLLKNNSPDSNDTTSATDSQKQQTKTVPEHQTDATVEKTDNADNIIKAENQNLLNPTAATHMNPLAMGGANPKLDPTTGFFNFNNMMSFGNPPNLFSSFNMSPAAQHSMAMAANANMQAGFFPSALTPFLPPNATKMRAKKSVPRKKKQKHLPEIDFINEPMTTKRITFQCGFPNCPATFFKSRSLYIHIKHLHGNHGLICVYCSKKSSCMANLVAHMRRHTKEKPFICPLASCNYRGTTKFNAKLHVTHKHGDYASKFYKHFFEQDRTKDGSQKIMLGKRARIQAFVEEDGEMETDANKISTLKTFSDEDLPSPKKVKLEIET